MIFFKKATVKILIFHRELKEFGVFLENCLRKEL